MKIKISDVDKMIKEEFQKMMEKKKLSSRLSQINEELNKMNSEDSVVLNEVEAGGKTKVSSHAWTGEENGDVKWDAKFEKKGSHLMEDEEEGAEVGAEMDAEMGGEMPGAEMDETPMGEFEAKFAEIGRAIDAKMNAEAGEAEGEEAGEEAGEEMGAEASDDDFEEVEVSDDENGEEEIEEYKEVVGGVGAEQGMTADQAVKESVDEPLEGESVAQMTDADDVNDNMEKDTHVNEGAGKKGAVITEAKKPEGKNIFTEGLDSKKKTALLEEFNRMKKFAGLSKDEE